MTTNLKAKLLLIAAIAVGSLALLDFFTDAQQIALAALCDSSFHSKWVLSGFLEVSYELPHDFYGLNYGFCMDSLMDS